MSSDENFAFRKVTEAVQNQALCRKLSQSSVKDRPKKTRFLRPSRHLRKMHGEHCEFICFCDSDTTWKLMCNINFRAKGGGGGGCSRFMHFTSSRRPSPLGEYPYSSIERFTRLSWRFERSAWARARRPVAPSCGVPLRLRRCGPCTQAAADLQCRLPARCRVAWTQLRQMLSSLSRVCGWPSCRVCIRHVINV